MISVGRPSGCTPVVARAGDVDKISGQSTRGGEDLDLGIDTVSRGGKASTEHIGGGCRPEQGGKSPSLAHGKLRTRRNVERGRKLTLHGEAAGSSIDDI